MNEDQRIAERDIRISKAQDQFWAEIQSAYQLKSGDLPPEACDEFDNACINAVECWLWWNGHD